MIIQIDPTLTPPEQLQYNYARKVADVYARTIHPDNKGGYSWNLKAEVPAKEHFLAASFSEEGTVLAHIGYLEYLTQSFAVHRKIVITPDIIWHTIMCEIASVVIEKPDLYASLFTTKPGEKIEILLPAGDPSDLPLDDLMVSLRSLVPTNIDTFLPVFTTTDEMALMTRYASFAETCTPYYRYSTFLCGFPSIDVRGEPEDYTKIVSGVVELIQVFADVGDIVLVPYLRDKILPLLAEFIAAYVAEDGDFFKRILTTQSCGSGGEIECNGWWARSMYVEDMSGKKPQNFPTHVARVPYSNKTTGRNFTLNCGLFFSREEDGFTVPYWGWVKNEIVD